MSWTEEAKKKAAIEAVKLIKDGQIVGLGTGSTVFYVLKELGRRVCEEKLRIVGIPTSKQTEDEAERYGIPLTNLDEHPLVDLAIDGADQVDPNLNLIKGMGGALTREKIVDNTSKFLVIVVDETKLTDRLGRRQPIPVEVIQFAIRPVMDRIKEMGAQTSIRLSRGKTQSKTSKYFVTDNGNLIIDAYFGEIDDAKCLEEKIKMIPGVIENGLFVNMTHRVYVGSKKGVRVMERK